MTLKLTTQQKQAIESIDKSMLVTAGAGSGKTLVLVQRYVEILQKQPELSVHNLLAVTYTRKAAKEMRTRIKARLKELYEEAKSKESEQANGFANVMRWHQCLADMDFANIETIHSFCQSLLRTFTVEIGLNPQLEILDEIERAQIIQESVDETLRQIIAADDTYKNILQHFPLETIELFIQAALKDHLQFKQIAQNWQNLNKQDFMVQIDNLLTRTQRRLLADLTIDREWNEVGNYIKASSYPQNNKLEEVRKQAAQLFCAIQELSQFFSNEIKSAVQVNNVRANNIQADKIKDEHLQIKKIKEAWQILLSLPDIGPLRMGGNSDEAKEMRAFIKTLIEKSKDYSKSKKKGYDLPVNLPEDLHENEQYWQFWQALISLSKVAQKIYREKKLEVGKFDFDDLITQAKTALEKPNSAVRKYYNEKLSHILVDEFQDTNFIQAEIISLLAGDKTKLFLIGDDKQSIYKFQGADLSTFNIWQRNSENTLVFADSFRSQPNIVNFVNSIFSVLLHEHHAHVDYRAKYNALMPQRATQASVEIMQLPAAEESNFTDDQLEGKAVANWIYSKVKEKALMLEKNGEQRPINYGDFAILVPRNKDLEIFESNLSEYGIPYVTSGGKTFLERQEIYDLENMLLFLSDPSNSHALLGVLRSPMFAIADDIIHNMVSTKNNLANNSANNLSNTQSLWQIMQDFAAKEKGEAEGKKETGPDYQSLYKAIIVLKRLLADQSVLTLSQLIYKIIRDTNYDLIALSLPDGKQRYKNIWKFYTLAQDDFDAAQFAQRLELARQLAVTEGNATIDNKGSVKLMTIHRAKGLEFPAVALPALNTSLNNNKSKLLFHQQFGIVLNTARTEQERDEGMPLPYQLGKTLDDDMDIAEKKRLLYVAMTRARDYLALFIMPEKSKRNSATEWLLPLIENQDNGHYQVVPINLDDLLAKEAGAKKEIKSEAEFVQTKTAGKNTKHDARDITEDKEQPTGRSAMGIPENKEQPAEHVLEYLPGVDMAPPAVSSFSYRITPSAKHNQPSAVLLGKYFHTIMQYLAQNEISIDDHKLAALADQFAQESIHPDFRQALIEEGKKLIAIYAKSKLQELFSQAKSICHEWSYYINSNDEQLSMNRPDLLLETQDGNWYLIDYKTDRFAESDLQQHALRHRPQLQRYSKDFNQLTNVEPKMAIYFAQHGILHQL